MVRRFCSRLSFFCCSITFLFAALLSSAAVQAQYVTSLPPQSAGSWYNPAQDGHGFNVEVLNETTILVYWYTYRPDGTSTFLVGTATTDGFSDTYSGDFFQTNGMIFGDFNPNDRELIPWGTFEFSFNDCNSARISWRSTLPGYTMGGIDLQKLTSLYTFSCKDELEPGNYAISYDSNLGARLTGIAILLPDGQMYFEGGNFGPEEIGVGRWTGNPTLDFRFDATVYVIEFGNAPPWETRPEGNLVDLSINGFGNSTGGFGGNGMSGVELREFRRAVTLAELAGTYDMPDGGTGIGSTTFTLDTEGNITGTFANGCPLNGQVTLPTRGLNQLHFTFAGGTGTSGCSGLEFEGAGFQVQADPRNRFTSITVILDNANGGYAIASRMILRP